MLYYVESLGQLAVGSPIEFESQETGSDDWKRLSDNRLWSELCLCVLSSNVVFESAHSAMLQLVNKELLDYNSFSHATVERISQELKRAIFLPRKKDGGFRTYRFPNIRAENIYNCGVEIRDVFGGLHNLLETVKTAEQARSIMVTNLTGIGMKEASMFLLNIGYSDHLAVLDTHILKFISMECNIELKGSNLTIKEYLNFERIFQTISRDVGVPPSILDAIVWRYSKDRLM